MRGCSTSFWKTRLMPMTTLSQKMKIMLRIFNQYHHLKQKPFHQQIMNQGKKSHKRKWIWHLMSTIKVRPHWPMQSWHWSLQKSFSEARSSSQEEGNWILQQPPECNRDCSIVGDSISRNYSSIVPKYAGRWVNVNCDRCVTDWSALNWDWGTPIFCAVSVSSLEYRNDSIVTATVTIMFFSTAQWKKDLKTSFYRRVTHIADIHYQRMHQMDLRAGINVSKTMGRFSAESSGGDICQSHHVDFRSLFGYRGFS